MLYEGATLGAQVMGSVMPAGSDSTMKSRKIYGHYMGSYAAGYGAIQYHALNGLATLNAPNSVLSDRSKLGPWAATTYGGDYRNFGLAPQNSTLTIEQAAELEIKRALRIGMNGFTFDAWAGGINARNLMDAMFTVCETQDLPFELTITMDTASMNSTDADLAVYSGNVWAKTIKWLLDHHGSSPKLARREGMVMIMGYQSIWPGQVYISDYVETNYPTWTTAEKNAEKLRLRKVPEGWQLIVDAYQLLEMEAGQSIYWEFCISQFFYGVSGVTTQMQIDAAAFLATKFPALGRFLWEGPVLSEAAAVVAAGKEWSHPMKLQYENFGYFQTASPGLNWVRGDWINARGIPCTLIQHITWNDYHECTNLSPGYNTRYAYYDITKYFINWWRTGEVPASDHDVVYLFSHKYAHNTPMFPFEAVSRADNLIEIITVLPSPAKLRCPGRVTTGGETEWTAPAGMSFKQFPLTPGPVSVELSRNDFATIDITLTCPEPVSDKPFRQDTGKVAISTECPVHWAIDFPSAGPLFLYSEYGDSDGDGLPNWFEMLWYGTFGIMSTAGVASPTADPQGTGKTNLQHFLDQTDPYATDPVDMLIGSAFFGALGFGGYAASIAVNDVEFPTNQFLRPNSNTGSGFTGGYTAVDEVSPSEVDYVYGSQYLLSAYIEFGLTDPMGMPAVTSGIVRYRVCKSDGSGGSTPSNSANPVTLTAQLYQGSTLLASDTPRVMSNAWTTYTWNFNPALVTDWFDLRVRFTSVNDSATPSNARKATAISWVEVEIEESTSSLSGDCIVNFTPAGNVKQKLSLSGNIPATFTCVGDVEATQAGPEVVGGGSAMFGVGVYGDMLLGLAEPLDPPKTSISGVCAVVFTVTGQVRSRKALSGTIGVESTVVGTVHIHQPLAGTIVAVSSLYQVPITQSLNGTIFAQSNVAGYLSASNIVVPPSNVVINGNQIEIRTQSDVRIIKTVSDVLEVST